jgi:hypothetical protein
MPVTNANPFPKWAGEKWRPVVNPSPEEYAALKDGEWFVADRPQDYPPSTLPTDKQERKETPIVAGVLDYFPAAIAAVANVSYVGNKQHNGDQPLHWARGKSMYHADCLVRHLVERGTMDTDGLRHTAKIAWRALALLQEELEREAGAPVPRGAKEVK